ncbi:MAG: single-stranded DNA-binding protein, partial [Planctomycetota bacterium]
MANLNKVLLIGRLTRDPETRTLTSGSAVVSFGLAVNRTYTRRDSGERVEETCFVDIEAWGRTGETIARYMRRGRQIFIEGRLKFDSWERDGQRRSKLSVVAETFQFLDSQGGGQGAPAGQADEPAQVPNGVGPGGMGTDGVGPGGVGPGGVGPDGGGP